MRRCRAQRRRDGVRRVRPRDPKTTPKILLYIISSFPSSSRFKHLARTLLAACKTLGIPSKQHSKQRLTLGTRRIRGLG